jgi:DNA mismatch repair ATPase MutS
MLSVTLEELKEYEAKILGAEEKIHKIESELFEQLVIWMLPISNLPVER